MSRRAATALASKPLASKRSPAVRVSKPDKEKAPVRAAQTRRKQFEQAAEEVFSKYDETFRKLAQ
ncbi:MAG TPA: hypothetical protein VL137_10665 [Polyangiaceae bacterium]|jgi:hypothetical protein|nr:hypothetical protein [Polyangiaceae bacterium]